MAYRPLGILTKIRCGKVLSKRSKKGRRNREKGVDIEQNGGFWGSKKGYFGVEKVGFKSRASDCREPSRVVNCR